MKVLENRKSFLQKTKIKVAAIFLIWLQKTKKHSYLKVFKSSIYAYQINFDM